MYTWCVRMVHKEYMYTVFSANQVLHCVKAVLRVNYPLDPAYFSLAHGCVGEDLFLLCPPRNETFRVHSS